MQGGVTLVILGVGVRAPSEEETEGDLLVEVGCPVEGAGVPVVTVVGIKGEILEEEVDGVDLVSLGGDVDYVVSVFVLQEDISATADQELDDLVIASVSGEVDCGETFRILFVNEVLPGRYLDLTSDALPVNL